MGAAICSDQQQTEQFGQIEELIEAAERIALCAHTGPDGDAAGSVLGLAALIEARWPNKEVVRLLADPEPLPGVYHFLAGADRYQHVADYQGAPDLFICVDLSDTSRLNEAEMLCQRAKTCAVIDHHPGREPFGQAFLVRPDAAATGVIVAEFAQWLHQSLTPATAQALLCAIVTDTGRFQFQNADGEAFQVASILVDSGASPSEISLHVYQSYRMEYLHLQAIVMGRIRTCAEGRVAYSWATRDDLAATGAHDDECNGLIDVVRSVAGSEVACFLREVEDGKVRANLRAKGEQDVSVVARELGGGGHKAAAAFTCTGTIGEVRDAVLEKLSALVGA